MLKRIKEFKINDYLDVVLDGVGVKVLVNNKLFRHCDKIPASLNLEHATLIEDLPLYDKLEKSIKVEEGNYRQIFELIPREDFYWAQCSTLQVWVENQYTTNLLTDDFSFSLLKSLVDAGDISANQVFEKEIIKRLESDYKRSIYFLIENGYLKHLSENNLTKQVARLYDNLDFEDIRELDLTQRLKILGNLASGSTNNQIKLRYISELKNAIQNGNARDVNTILWGLYDGELNYKDLNLEELVDILQNIEVNYVKVQEIENLLTILEFHDFGDSEVNKKIIKNVLNKEKDVQELIEFLIYEQKLDLIEPVDLESLDVKKLSLGERDFYLSAIPKEIGKLKSLEELSIYEERDIETLPEELFSLPLKKIYIIGCERLEIPDLMGNLGSLEELHLGYIGMHNLPASIKSIKTLKKLVLHGINLNSFPVSICEIEKLKVLDLGFNKIPSLPANFENLRNLEILNLECNQLSEFPEGITSITSLKELSIGGNSFHELPYSIGNLNSLEKLRLSTDFVEYGNLETLPESIGNLESLKELDVSFNHLKKLPNSIGNLKNLKSLSLYHNRLTQLPNSIGKLVKLKNLDLHHNKLKFLPESIKNLKNLTKLNLNDNFFDNLPEASSREPFYEKSITDIKGIFQNVKFIDLDGEIDILQGTSTEYIKNIIKESDLTKINALFWNNIFEKLSPEEFKRLWYDNEISLLDLMLTVNLEINKNLNLGDIMKRDYDLIYVDYPKQLIEPLSEAVGNNLIKIIERKNQTEIEILIKLGYLQFLSESQITSLLDMDDNIFSAMVLRWGYLDDALIMKIEQFLKKNEISISEYIIGRWLRAFHSGNLEQIFNVWDNFWLGHCTENHFLELIDHPDIHFLNDLLKAIHHFGYKKDYDHTCSLFPLLPNKFERVAHEKLKKQVIDVLRANDIETFVPLIGTQMLNYLDSEDLLQVINESDIHFLDNYLTALNKNHWELYYYNELFFVWNDKFRKFLNKFGILVVEEDDLYFQIHTLSSALYLRNEKGEFVTIGSQRFYVRNGELNLKECFIEDLNKVKGLFDLKDLNKLDLSNNLLKEIPESINRLRNLAFLSLRSNHLKKIPDSIGDLKNLKILDLSSNDIDQLPFSLGTISSLQILNLERNKLKTIPNSLMRLENLRELYLGSNNIISLPNHLFDYKKDDHIKGWINAVYHFEDQERIFQNVKNMKKLWETIGRIDSLELLDLNRNRVDKIPQPLFNLKSLKVLNMNFNELEALPNELWNFKNLETLLLGFNKLKSIPETIQYLENLKILNLESNNLDSLPTSIIEIKSLKEVNLYRNISRNMSNNLITIAKRLKEKGIVVHYGK